MLFVFLVSGTGYGQILVMDPDDFGTPEYREAHTGVTLAGTSGLITVPTADFTERGAVRVSYKGGITKRDLNFNGVAYKTSKNEHYTAATYNIDDNLELSINHLEYERSSKPTLAGLTYHEDSTAFGMKYSAHNGRQDFCFGVAFAPMDAEELNKADLWQLEHLRTVYLTVTEGITDSLQEYMHAKTCSTDEQNIALGGGQVLKINRKDFLASAIGLELSHARMGSFFCEGQFFNYRDLFAKDSVRFSFNAGLRFGKGRYFGEVFGLSLNQDPRMMLGVNAGF